MSRSTKNRAVGRTIRRLREKAGLSIPLLAKEARIPYGTLQSWESYPHRPNPDNPDHRARVEAIARVLNVKPEDVWDAQATADLDQQLEQELSTFLLRVAFDPNVPTHLRAEARALASRILQ